MEERKTMPVIALRGLTVLPKMMIHFDVSRARSIAAVERAMIDDQKVFLVTQKNPDDENPSQEQLHQIGTIAVVKQLVKLPGGLIRVMVEGLFRGELLCLESTDPALTGEVAVLTAQEDELDCIAREAMARVLKDKLEEYGQENQRAAKEILPNLMIIMELDELMDQIAIQIPWDYTVRQEVLDHIALMDRYEKLLQNLTKEIEVLRIKRDFQAKVKAAIDKNQKDYILREQMRIIREELGEDNPDTEGDEYQEQLNKLSADKETKEKIQKEINRFKTMPSGSQEANVLRTYIETLLELPWNKVSRDNQNLKHAEKILNEDHYGLEKVKERILEYLAVRILRRSRAVRFYVL